MRLLRHKNGVVQMRMRNGYGDTGRRFGWIEAAATPRLRRILSTDEVLQVLCLLFEHIEHGAYAVSD